MQNSKINSHLRKNNLTTVYLFALISFSLSYYLFNNYGTYSRDDNGYIQMARCLLSSGILSWDNNCETPHTLFPPGYSLLIALFSWFQPDYFYIRAIEASLYPALISLLTYHIIIKCEITPGIFSLLMIFFPPALILGTVSLLVSVEPLYTVVILTGIIFSIMHRSTKAVIHIILSAACFSYSYLLRPEGIFFLGYLVIFSFLNRDRNADWVKQLCIAGVISSLITLPYVIYLHENLGYLTLTGKGSYNELKVGINGVNWLEHLPNNLFSLLRVYISPFLWGISTIILIIILTIRFRTFLRNLNGTLYSMFQALSFPFLALNVLMLYFMPWGRALYVFVPFAVILAVFTYEKLSEFQVLKQKHYEKKVILFVAFSLQFTNIGFPFAVGRYDDSPSGYYRLVDRLSQEGYLNESVRVYSRDTTLHLYHTHIEICNDIKLCGNVPNFVIISNSYHDKLTRTVGLDKNVNAYDKEIPIFGGIYEELMVFERNNFWFKVFKRKAL